MPGKNIEEEHRFEVSLRQPIDAFLLKHIILALVGIGARTAGSESGKGLAIGNESFDLVASNMSREQISAAVAEHIGPKYVKSVKQIKK
jgi:hypothetical protein